MTDVRAATYIAIQNSIAAEKPTIDEMAAAAEAEADRIEVVQAGLVEQGMRPVPDLGQIRAAAVWTALSRFLVLIQRHQDEVRRLLQHLETKGAPRRERDRAELG